MPRRGTLSTGGARPRGCINPDGRPMSYEPAPSEVGLLRAVYAKRRTLTPRETTIVRAMLERVQKRRLTEREAAFLGKLAAQVGAVYEEPPEPVTQRGDARTGGHRPVQPWGPLPLRPPTKRAEASDDAPWPVGSEGAAAHGEAHGPSVGDGAGS